MRVLKTTAAILFLVAVFLSADLTYRVHSQANMRAADQANVAATTNATWIPGSVDLEGVPANDKTTYTFRTDVNPPAAGGPPAEYSWKRAADSLGQGTKTSDHR